MSDDGRRDRPRDATAILQLERAGWERWQTVVRGLAPEARRSDGWRVQDVVAHIAAWHRRGAQDLATIASGADDDDRIPTDAFNARVRRAGADRSWDEVATEADAAHAAFVSAITAAAPATLEGRDGLGATLIAENGWEHYADHMGDTFET